jgi:hypothetical protein
MSSATSSLKKSGGIAIPIQQRTHSKMSTTAVSLTQTNISRPASPAAKPTVGTFTSTGVHPLRSNSIQPVAAMIAQPDWEAAPPPPTRGSCGAIGTSKALAKISRSNWLIAPVPANAASPEIPAKKTRWHTSR